MSNYEDWNEPLNEVLYLRFQSGPDLEQAYLCVRDGEPDMHDLARMSFKQARLLKELFKTLTKPPISLAEYGNTWPVIIDEMLGAGARAAAVDSDDRAHRDRGARHIDRVQQIRAEVLKALGAKDA